MGLTARFFNQGRVDSILLECDGEYAFIDGGYRKNGLRAAEHMRKLGVARLKYYIASHGHKNHIGAAAAIIGKVGTGAIIIPRAKVLQAIIRYADSRDEIEAIDGCEVSVLRKGDYLTLGRAKITRVGPDKQIDCSCGAYRENYNSLILRVDYTGEAQLLLTGDTSAAIIAKCGACARAKILKNPHHAGTQPASLLEQVKPDAVVVCSNARASRLYRNRIEKAGARVREACKGEVAINC